MMIDCLFPTVNITKIEQTALQNKQDYDPVFVSENFK